MRGEITEFVVTGGPCSGKTTFMSYAAMKLWEAGIRPLVAPEAATLLLNPGIPDVNELAKNNRDAYVAFERAIIKTQVHFDDCLRELAESLAEATPSRKIVILRDRGIPDAEAYLTEDEYGTLLKECGLAPGTIRNIYQHVIHLVTAANGAPEFYTTDNNKARRESLEEARRMDERTLNAWIGRDRLTIIDNSTDFEHKMRRAYQTVARALNIPVPAEIQRKYIIIPPCPDIESGALGHIRSFIIEQSYLPVTFEGEQVQIRKSTHLGRSFYYKITKRNIFSLSRYFRTQAMITAKDYQKLFLQRDKECEIIHKIRHCFAYKHQYFRYDVFSKPFPLHLLEVECTEDHPKVTLPPHIKNFKDVTYDPRYANYMIARKNP